MTHLIDKSALVAEIKRQLDCCYKICAGNLDFLQKSYPEHYYSIETYKEILSFLDTLEVKEIGVDLGDPRGDIGVKTVWDSSNLLGISRHGNPHIEDDLEDAATKYAQNKYLPVQTAQSFKAGAQWQKEQMIDKACEWWENELTYPSMTHEEIDYYQSKIVAFRKAMEE